MFPFNILYLSYAGQFGYKLVQSVMHAFAPIAIQMKVTHRQNHFLHWVVCIMHLSNHHFLDVRASRWMIAKNVNNKLMIK